MKAEVGGRGSSREDWSWEGAREGRSAQGGISGQGSHVKSKRSRVLNADMCRVLCEALSVHQSIQGQSREVIISILWTRRLRLREVKSRWGWGWGVGT